MFTADSYKKRRNLLRKKFDSGLLLFLGNHISPINSSDMAYPFRQDSSFLYFFGHNIQDMAGLIDTQSDIDILFGHNPNAEDALWNGAQISLEVQRQTSGAAKALELEMLKPLLEKALNQGRRVHFLPPYKGENLLHIHHLLGIEPSMAQRHASTKLVQEVIALREIKSADEVREIESAVNLTGEMILQSLHTVKPGYTEKEAAAKVKCIADTKSTTSFPTILTTRGCYLHIGSYDNVMKSGQLVIQDCGAESINHYAADITRTFPVDGRFTSKQKEIYQIVQTAQDLALANTHPGVEFRSVHRLVCLHLCHALKDLGIMKDDPEEAVACGAHALFFPCGLGHALGLDTHDMRNLGEDYVGYTTTIKRSSQFGLNRLRLGKELRAGMTITVEPGVYFTPELIEKWQSEQTHASFINFEAAKNYQDVGGVRLEDDFLITEDGNRLLGSEIPKQINEIEEIMSQT